MAKDVLNIEVEVTHADGDIAISPALGHVARTVGKINWTAKKATALVLTFKGGARPVAVESTPGGVRTPVNVVQAGPVPSGGVGATVFALDPGKFTYEIAVTVEGKTYEDTGCPEIIIQ